MHVTPERVNPLDRVLDPASIIRLSNTSSIRDIEISVKISYKRKKKKKNISRDYNSLSEFNKDKFSMKEIK